MRFDQLTPNKPRPMSAVFVGSRPGSDARWRGVPKRTKIIDRARVHEMQLKARSK